jgi:dienelactone hydrolase
VAREREDEFTVERGRFESEKERLVPFLLYRPKSTAGRMPAVIVLHGTGGNKEGMAETLRELARRGMLTIAIDARYHGARVPGGAHGSQEYNEAILRAYREPDPKRQEHPFYYDTVYDLWRTVDYLQSRPDVDGDRIGMIGFSMGGIETWLAAATDTRIRVAVPAIGVQSLKWSLEHEQWQGRANTIRAAHEAVARELGEPAVNARVCRALWSKVVPGILDDFDCPRMLESIAPRPLLIVNGEKDPNCPLEGAKIAFAAAGDAYRQAKAEDRLEIDVAPGVAHAVTPAQRQKAYTWLERWLKPSNYVGQRTPWQRRRLANRFSAH